MAWLWAFTKPTHYKLAYGTDKHDDFFLKPDGAHADKALDLSIVDDEMLLLKEKLDGLNRKRDLILSKQMIPVAPAEHYHMGGIATDPRGRTYYMSAQHRF